MADPQTALHFLEKHSLFASRWLNAQPQWRAWLAERLHTPIEPNQIDGLLLSLWQSLSQESLEETVLMGELRLARQRLMLWIAYRDLNSLAALDEVTHALSYFAQQSLAYTTAFIRKDLKGRFGLPSARSADYELPLMIVGMGKLGGKELNLSSDIDLIFLYEEEGDTQGGSSSISNHEWFTKLGRRLIKIIAEHDENGFVFRVDMRLRPNGDSGPLVCSLEMLEEYLFVQGREWERYAWIKGRMIHPLSDHPDHARCEKGLIHYNPDKGGIMAKAKAETVEAVVETEETSVKATKAPKGVAKLEEEGDIAADYLEALLDIADLDGDIDIDVENDRAALAIVGGKLSHLVGSSGEVLDAIQELTRLAVQTSTGDRSRLMLDIDGFRAGRRTELKKLAEDMAEEAKTTGNSIKLKPMNAFERKIIHDTIQDLGLSSESDGEDPNRFVVIYPA